MNQGSQEKRGALKWYWFLETEVIASANVACLILVVLVFKSYRVTLATAYGGIAALWIVATCRERVFEHLGPSRARPSKGFKAFWWFVILAEGVASAFLA